MMKSEMTSAYWRCMASLAARVRELCEATAARWADRVRRSTAPVRHARPCLIASANAVMADPIALVIVSGGDCLEC
jgi:hypothetical protein